VWKLATGEELGQLLPHAVMVRGLDISRDGKLVVSCGQDGMIRIVRIATNEPLLTIQPRGGESHVQTVSFAPEQDRFTATSWDGRLELRSAFRAEQVTKLTGVHPTSSLHDEHGPFVYARFSKDGSRILSCDTSGVVALWNGRGEVIARASGMPGMKGLGFIDARRAVTMSPHGIELWALGDSIERVNGFDVSTSSLRAFALSPDGKRAVTGVGEHPGPYELWLWDLETGGHKKLRGPSPPWVVNAVTFTPDGRYAISGSRGHAPSDLRLMVWDLDETE
jgi:WD40 repeat protein